MEQIKIGNFIKERRMNKKITQSELAEKLNITDRAVSKWERGICMPDSSIMLELCKILDISINDLYSGEVVDMKDTEKKYEENLLEMTKLKELKDKQLLALEWVVGYISVGTFLVIMFLISYIKLPTYVGILLAIFAITIMLVGMFFSLRIEQVAGYYKCDKCNHKYIPTYKSVFFAMHIGRTRYMKCPLCHKWSWNKKVINKSE